MASDTAVLTGRRQVGGAAYAEILVMYADKDPAPEAAMSTTRTLVVPILTGPYDKPVDTGRYVVALGCSPASAAEVARATASG